MISEVLGIQLKLIAIAGDQPPNAWIIEQGVSMSEDLHHQWQSL
jgi:hypothetical protein